MIKVFVALFIFIFAFYSHADNSTYLKGPMLVKSNQSVNSDGGTIQLNAVSQMDIAITGTNTETVKLPNTASIAVGYSYNVLNKSTQNVLVQDFSGSLVDTVYPNTDKKFILFSGNSWKATVGGSTGKTLNAGANITIVQDATSATISSSSKTLVGSSPISIAQDSTTATFSFAGVNLDDVLDVDTASATEGQLLGYNSSTLKWEAKNPVSSAGGGLYVYPWTTSSAVVPAYNQFFYTPQNIATTNVSASANNNTVLMATYIYDSAYGDTVINGGEWVFDFFRYVSNSSNVTTLRFDVFTRTSTGTETVLFSITSSDINDTVVTENVIKTIQPSYSIASTSYLGLKVYATTTRTTNTAVTFTIGDSVSYSRVGVPFASRHNELRGIQGGASNAYYHNTLNQNTVMGTFSASGTVVSTSADLQMSISKYFYFGDSLTDGTIRMYQSGGALIKEKRVSGTYVEISREDNL